jgi:transcriptional regulator with XRE-family HTH domain
MPDKITGLLGPRRRIATALKRLREESNQNLADVSAALLISTSKLSRLENAQGTPRLRDVRDLTRHYGQEDTRLATQLERWTKAAQVPGWWTDYDEEALRDLDSHLAYETDAAVERVYTLPFVPALLQTDAYAEAVFREMERRPDDQVRQLMDIRRVRKEALKDRDGMDPLRLVAVTHESTLRQKVGSWEIVRDQLDELLMRSRDDNVELHVFPFSAEPVMTMTCMWAYFEYQDPDDLEQDLVHIETHAGFWDISNKEQVEQYREWHRDLVEASLGEDESRALIKDTRDSLLLSGSER